MNSSYKTQTNNDEVFYSITNHFKPKTNISAIYILPSNATSPMSSTPQNASISQDTTKEKKFQTNPSILLSSAAKNLHPKIQRNRRIAFQSIDRSCVREEEEDHAKESRKPHQEECPAGFRFKKEFRHEECRNPFSSWCVARFPKDPQQEPGWLTGPGYRERENETEGRRSSEGRITTVRGGHGVKRGKRTTSGPPRFRQFEGELVGQQSSSGVQYETWRKCKWQSFVNLGGKTLSRGEDRPVLVGPSLETLKFLSVVSRILFMQ